MPQQEEFDRYAVLARRGTIDLQNPQELASELGTIENECEDIGIVVEEMYVSLGPFDFLIILDAPSPQTVVKSSLIMSRHGLDVQTMSILEREQFADIVSDM